MTDSEFQDRVRSARLRVEENDRVNGRNRCSNRIFDALEAGLKNKDGDRLFDAYVMMHDRVIE